MLQLLRLKFLKSADPSHANKKSRKWLSQRLRPPALRKTTRITRDLMMMIFLLCLGRNLTKPPSRNCRSRKHSIQFNLGAGSAKSILLSRLCNNLMMIRTLIMLKLSSAMWRYHGESDFARQQRSKGSFLITPGFW